MMEATVGVCAYNEEKNIEGCIRSVLEQDLQSAQLKELIVVSSGSTDGTEGIVGRLQTEEPRIRLITQDRRKGKNSAINDLLDASSSEIVVLVNADNRLAPQSLENLLRPFQDRQVGVAGGRPVPTNELRSNIGFAVHMLWDMHHRLALIHPKIGELMAFRNNGTRLPLNMQSDEDIIRMKLEEEGYTSIYVPEAVVYNRGPETLRDFLKQRKRVNIGERMMRKSFSYEVPTWNPEYLFNAYLGFIRETGPHPFRISLAIGMELYARAYATVHVALEKGDIPVWEQVGSTKKLE
ncbi:MAG: glycosyltransferase family 2 protein [Candidatus Methanomethylophilaceae archaeon]